jgi:predicted Fe-Mo cluster-binding NifX family protein
MKVAVTIWEDRISPLFDASRRLLVAEIDNGRITERTHFLFDPSRPSTLAKAMMELQVDTLICGAVSRTPADTIAACGVTLIPFIAGDVDSVLEAFVKHHALIPAFSMPGCRDSGG